ncbi:hypothetical protein B7R54_01720 [Subtercola boreus]|uniref:FtsK domain-containing protein n=1 Tax=Subtercola boreus TaxID=120213 RepID=A0A3E0VEU8_9MICO|nr:hypothetical protein [Subtercola boreus]RFA08073.1 hypothetical protein B7R54_01720 [Subtercola boreus]TQL55047.1 hypothetical protein FB464_2602 [Subtercola boreus]
MRNAGENASDFWNNTKDKKPEVAIFLFFVLVWWYALKLVLWTFPRRFPKAAIWFWVTVLLVLPLLHSNYPITAVIPVAVGIYAQIKLQKVIANRRMLKGYLLEVASLMDAKLGTEFMANHLRVSSTAKEGVLQLSIRTPRHFTDDQMLATMPIVAAGLQLVRVSPLNINARQGNLDVLLLGVDPLTEDLDPVKAGVLNLTEQEQNNVFHWLDVGTTELGDPLQIPMFLKEGGAVRALHSGLSGAGKSSIIRQQLLWAVNNPNIDVGIIDGKGDQFTWFKNGADRYIKGQYGKEAFLDFLTWLESERDRRGLVMGASKLVNFHRQSDSWNPTDDGNELLVVWDELSPVLGHFTTSKEKAEIQDRLYGILSVARSLGMAFILSSQTFPSYMLETRIRDLCFDLGVGYKQPEQDAKYIGFTSLDLARPDLIRGVMVESGRLSCAGQFAVRGLSTPGYGKSYYISAEQIVNALPAPPEPSEEAPFVELDALEPVPSLSLVKAGSSADS